jgi:hypothetical protein
MTVTQDDIREAAGDLHGARMRFDSLSMQNTSLDPEIALLQAQNYELARTDLLTAQSRLRWLQSEYATMRTPKGD